ncbi:unnamed protein product [Peronospora destructor]|uniref:Uncharacterized protein n=1 Tax=Peronospora destructor TaxID=86335 RepID=A0AAV0THY8_9STRA|nr:unnamed protein product [Peronospora destructor]
MFGAIRPISYLSADSNQLGRNIETLQKTATEAEGTVSLASDDMLELLLDSSSTGGTTAASFASGHNPLFTQSIGWSPRKREMRLILEERESLKNSIGKLGRWLHLFMPPRPASASVATMNSRSQKQQSSLFATDSSSGSGFGGQLQPAEDDLWKLLSLRELIPSTTMETDQ